MQRGTLGQCAKQFHRQGGPDEQKPAMENIFTETRENGTPLPLKRADQVSVWC
jgi:hypothetical protein